MRQCGVCASFVPKPEDLTTGTCYGLPPTPVLMPVQQGAVTGMGVQLLRPAVPRVERACSLWQAKVIAQLDVA